LSLGTFAFEYCINLTNAVLGDGITNIGAYAFWDCKSLINITIPSNVINIGDYAFYICSNLKGLYFEGNPPVLGSSVFLLANNATAYFLPVTIDWGTTYGGRPTKLWNPQMQSNGSSFGVQTNKFGFNITGTSNLVVIAEACTNLANPIWLKVGTNTLLGGMSYFGDPKWANYPCRFYRLRSP
jgi:BspA type Leucine rich repeat region (6 copies)